MRSFLFFLFLAVPAFAQPVEIAGRAQVPPQCGPARVSLFPARSPGEQARLRLAGEDDRALASARVRADGVFAITAPEAGLFRVVIEAKGCIPVEQAVAAALELEMPPAVLELARPLEVVVLGAGGQPAAGVPVVMGPPVREDRRVWPIEAHILWRAVYRHGVTGPDGRLVLQRGEEERWGLDLWVPGAPFTELAPRDPTRTLRIEERRYRLLVRSAAGHPLPGAVARWGPLPLAVSGPDGRLEVGAASGERIVVEGTAGEIAEVYLPKTGDRVLEVVLAPPPRVRGRAVDAVSRMPLADAVVWSVGPPAVRSAADGTFTLALRAGRRQVIEIAGAAAGYLPESLVFQEGREPVLALLPATGIRGTVSEAAGRPIAGAEVSALAADWFDNSRFVQHQARTWTSADGSFRLLGLPAGILVRLVARKACYAAAERLADGASTAPVEIVLGPGGAIAGRVLDPEGLPIADARVTLDSEQPALLPNGERLQAATDAAGRFRFSDLAPGRFGVTVEREGFLPVPRSRVEVPSPPREVEVADVTLEAESWIEGEVVDARGEPLPDAQAHPTRSSTSPGGPLSVYFPQGGRSGADGRFRIAGLQPGVRYDIRIDLKGYLPGIVPDVEAPTREPVRIVLEAAPVITGRVTGPSGEPVASAEVRARLDSAAAEAWTSDTQSSADGSFRLPVREPGSSTLAVTAQGYRTRFVPGIQIPDRGEAGPFEITLEKGAVLTGRVLDAQGKGVSGAMVSARSEVPLSGTNRAPTVITDEEGRYRLEGLDLGPQTVSAQVRSRMLRIPVEIRLGTQSLDLRFAPTVRVSGRVIDAAGVPVAGAQVYLGSEDGDNDKLARTISGPDGTFVLEAQDGTYRLTADARGFAQGILPDPVHVAGRDLEGLELRLAPEETSPPRPPGSAGVRMMQSRAI